MSDKKYRINLDYVPPEPTPADFFSTVDVPETPEERDCILKETFDRWREEGITQVRVTLTGPTATDDKTGYPPGLWLEGWKDPKARQLPFGHGYPDRHKSPCYPPLTVGSAAR